MLTNETKRAIARRKARRTVDRAKKFICYALLFAAFTWLFTLAAKAPEYNKKICATYGMQEDCKTPLN